MFHSLNKSTQKLSIFLTAMFTIGLIISGCTESTSPEEKRTAMISKVDSLWTQLNAVRQQFTYEMDEIEERKEEMQQQLIRANFLKAEQLTEEQKLWFVQYESVARIYKGVGQKYKNCVLEAENIFYALKGLDSEVKKGKYDDKLDDFRAEYAEIEKELKKCAEETNDVTSRLSTVEPTYLRLGDNVDSLLDELIPIKE
jgi:peptidoglycan hydrolase CwlO-like protein